MNYCVFDSSKSVCFTKIQSNSWITYYHVCYSVLLHCLQYACAYCFKCYCLQVFISRAAQYQKYTLHCQFSQTFINVCPRVWYKINGSPVKKRLCGMTTQSIVVKTATRHNFNFITLYSAEKGSQVFSPLDSTHIQDSVIILFSSIIRTYQGCKTAICWLLAVKITLQLATIWCCLKTHL